MKLIPNNWLYNAGLVGLLRILQAKGVDIDSRLNDDGFELQAEDLEGFADVYCKKVLQNSLERLISRLDQKDRDLFNRFGVSYTEMRNNCLAQLNEELQSKLGIDQSEQKVIDVINAFADNLKDIIEKNFEEQQLQISQSNPTTKSEQKELEKMGKELDKNYRKIAKVIEEKLLKIKTGNKRLEISSYIKQQKYLSTYFQHFYFNKDTIANPVPLPTGQRRSQKFKERFVDPAIKLLSTHETNNNTGLVCKFCGRMSIPNNFSTRDKPRRGEQRLKDRIFNEGMFSISGVSIEQFPNFFYNLIPDLFICDVCELVLLCAWAGFNLIPFRLRSGGEDSEYLFINLPSLSDLWKDNESIRKWYQRAQVSFRDTIYEDILSDLFSEERRKRSKWTLQNILFVEIRTVPSKQRDKPAFKYFHVGKDIAELFTNSDANRSLGRIRGNIFAPKKEERPSLNLKREVTKRLLEGDQIYDLTHQVFRQNLDSSINRLPSLAKPINVLELVFLHSLRRQIWQKYNDKSGSNSNQMALGGKSMESRQVYGILNNFYKVGKLLADAVTQELPPDKKLEKCQQMSYRLMSVVRSGKYVEFYDMLMKLYVDSQRPIPHELISLLNSNDMIEFESKAYALLSGFLSEIGQASIPESAGAESAEPTEELSSKGGEDNG